MGYKLLKFSLQKLVFLTLCFVWYLKCKALFNGVFLSKALIVWPNDSLLDSCQWVAESWAVFKSVISNEIVDYNNVIVISFNRCKIQL